MVKAQTIRRTIEPHITGQFHQGDIRHCDADISRAKVLLDFVPTTEWEESLLEIITWAQSVPNTDRFEQAQQELQARGLVR